jgi:SAM-dependent methyltransferase
VTSHGFRWEVGRLPFLWTPLDRAGADAGLPTRLPFALEVSAETGVLSQAPDAEVSAALVRAYEAGSVVSGLMEETGIGREYADDILGFIEQCAPGGVAGSRILEIGCGTGYLLHRLRKLGADVVGIEPGGHNLESAMRYDVPIVRGFFPSADIDGGFDVVVMYAVLEHIEDPVSFLRTVRSHLRPDGRTIIAVPDCEPYLATGDLSILIHEHWSYFTARTLRDVAHSAGLQPVHATRAGFGGSTYLCAERASSAAPVPATEIARQGEAAAAYRRRAEAGLARLRSWLDDAATAGATVGLYVPGRAINALALAGSDAAHIRFFDDDPRLHGTYLPGFGSPIESRAQLIDRPPDRVLIMSHTFGARIAAALAGLVPGQVVVQTWGDVYDSAVGSAVRPAANLG